MDQKAYSMKPEVCFDAATTAMSWGTDKEMEDSFDDATTPMSFCTEIELERGETFNFLGLTRMHWQITHVNICHYEYELSIRSAVWQRHDTYNVDILYLD